MKKNIKFGFSVIAAAVLLTCAAFFGGCGKETVTAVSITASGAKATFAYGAEFSVGNLKVNVNMSDGSSYLADENAYEVDSSAFDSKVSGQYTIRVTLKETDLFAEYTVTVRDDPSRWDADGELKILCIGNSFSDDMTVHAYNVAKSLGIEKVYIANLYIGGCTVDRHADNAKNNAAAYEFRQNDSGTWHTTKNYRMGDAIALTNWDFITLQQASGSSGMEGTYARVGELIDYVYSKLPPMSYTKFYWHMTWAYQQDTNHAEFYKYDNKQSVMYDKIVQCTKTRILTNASFTGVIPSGTAVQNARTSYLGDTLTRDGYHLTIDTGRYIAALTFISTLTQIPVDDIEFAPDGVDARKKAVALESAANAIKTPYSVTMSVNK